VCVLNPSAGVYQWYLVRLRVRTYTYTCTYVPVYVRTYNVMSQLYQWYLPYGIMLCHNFLIGKGHTCALRTTCVLGGYTYTCTYHGAYTCTMVHVYHGTLASTMVPVHNNWYHGTRVRCTWVLVFQVVFEIMLYLYTCTCRVGTSTVVYRDVFYADNAH
jgi:hypothetical protein